MAESHVGVQPAPDGDRPAAGPAAREYPQARFVRPAGAAELLLVRHGESQPARADRPFPLVGGQGDPGLAPVGLVQAERVAERLAGEHVDAIYVTTLCRTEQTARPLAERLGLTPAVEPDLREVHLGEWEAGRYRERVAEGDPLATRMFTEQRWDVIPGAEPSDAFVARVRAAVERLASAHPDQRVVVFTHGGTIGQLLSLATGSGRFAFIGADNGSISHLVVVPGAGEGDGARPAWMVRRYNDTAHLEAGFTTRAASLL